MTRRLLLVLAGAGLLTMVATVCSCTIEEQAPQTADLLPDLGAPTPSLGLSKEGLEVDGQLIAVGTNIDTVTQLLGPVETTREMGLAGRIAGYGSLGLEFQVAGDDHRIAAIHLFAGFPGSAPIGTAPGVTEAALVETLGEGTTDPYGLGRLYPAAGLTVGLAQGIVTTVTLTGPWE